jgi:hypothetical protein
MTKNVLIRYTYKYVLDDTCARTACIFFFFCCCCRLSAAASEEEEALAFCRCLVDAHAEQVNVHETVIKKRAFAYLYQAQNKRYSIDLTCSAS